MTADAPHGPIAQPGRPLRWAAIGIAMFAVLAAAISWLGYSSQRSAAIQDVQLRARGAAADVDRYVQSQWNTLIALASLPAVQSADLDQMRSLFDRIDPVAIGLDAGVSFVDARGWMVARTGGYDGPPIDFSDRDHIQRALASRQPVASAAVAGAVNAVPVIAFAVPIVDPEGILQGLVAAGVRLSEGSLGAQNLRSAGGTDVVILDGLGQIIGGERPVDSIRTADEGFPLEVVHASPEGALESAVGPYGDPDLLIGYASVPSAGYTVVVRTPAAIAFGPARTGLALQLLAIVAGASIGIALLMWGARRLERAAESERQTLAELRVAVDTLARRQALSDAFVGVMSHELRTPVTTIYGGLQLLRRDRKREGVSELIDDIVEESDRLRRITEDLLVLSRAEHGIVEVHSEPILVQRLVPDAVAEVERRFPTLDIDVVLEANLPAVSGDSSALRQVLANLITNAAKYAEGSRVSVRAEAVADRVRIVVSDGGPGVPADELPRLFELFYRSPSTERRASGTGIGLFVVRELVGAMGGEVTAELAEPHGLRVVVSMPRYEVEAETVDAEPGTVDAPTPPEPAVAS
jgi:signal transduction histidine kinase